MSRETTELLKQALSLSEEERAVLAASLLNSLDTTADLEVEQAWQQEIARRLDDLDSGKAKKFPWTDIRQRLSEKLSRGD